jgi:hypothetical protein
LAPSARRVTWAINSKSISALGTASGCRHPARWPPGDR